LRPLPTGGRIEPISPERPVERERSVGSFAVFGVFPKGNSLGQGPIGSSKGGYRLSAKVKAARLSVASNSLLIVAKLFVGLLTGSVSVMSEAIHSGIDLVAAVIALFSVRVSGLPADREHNYGHGKVENLSALVEGALILVAAVWIVVEAVGKLRGGHEAPPVLPGILVMALSSVVNWLVSGNLFRVAKAEGSMALQADGMHLRTDVWTSAGVLGGLLLVQITGLAWLDPAVAMVVACMIAKAGYDLCREALWPLVDTRLPVEEEAEIVRIIEGHNGAYVGFHDLRTRQSGAQRHVDFHLVVHGGWPLAEVHDLCDRIENALLDRFPGAGVLIHPEPCDQACPQCARRVRRVQAAGVFTRHMVRKRQAR